MWGLWWTKRHWGRFSPSTSVSPANHSTDFSIIIIIQGWHKRPLSGRSAEWTLIPPPTMQIKKKGGKGWKYEREVSRLISMGFSFSIAMKLKGLWTPHKIQTTSIFTAHFSYNHFSIIFPSTPRSPSYPFSVNFPNKMLYSCSLYMLHPHLSYFLFQSPSSPNYVICWPELLTVSLNIYK
jgi:hypothetical protein